MSSAEPPEQRRICWWLPAYPPDVGGVETFAAAVAPELHRRGRSLDLLIGTGGPSDDDVDGLRHMRYPLRLAVQSTDPTELIRARRWVHDRKTECDPDLYHVHFADATALLHLTSSNSAPAPNVLTLHNEPSDWLAAPAQPGSFVERLFAASEIITGVSASVIRRFAEEAPRFAHRMVAIPNGMRIGDEPPPLPAEPRILAFGRMTAQKGFDRLIRALPALVARVPDVRIDFVGDGKETRALKSLARELDLVENVNFWPAVPAEEVADWMEFARVVVTPSRFEGLCLVALEAAERGRPVVATNVSGLDNVIVDGETGSLVDKDRIDDDPELLVEPLVELLSSDGPADAFGANARERAIDVFGLDTCVSAYEFVYDSMFAEPVDLAVVVPAFNAERFLADSLESILDDLETTDLTFDVILVDDGSHDRTAEIAERFAGRGVRVFRQPNLGGGLARNAGIALTKSRFVTTFDSDDLWPSGRADALVAPLTVDPDLEAVFGATVEFDDGAPPGSKVTTEPQVARVATTGVVRRDVFERYGGFREGQFDVFEWSVRAIADGLSYRTIDEIVLRRRIHADNISHDLTEDHHLTRLRILRAAQTARTARTADP
ncbi:MAG: glycosyltransferase [Ilumatobacter fluminis]|uniref:glycosyltransferase n=1 Tax=Ilumatobacter fluminis TaxID=467091 RepID=UPI0032EA9604